MFEVKVSYSWQCMHQYAMLMTDLKNHFCMTAIEPVC